MEGYEYDDDINNAETLLDITTDKKRNEGVFRRKQDEKKKKSTTTVKINSDKNEERSNIFQFMHGMSKIMHNIYDGALARKFVEIDLNFTFIKMVLVTLTLFTVVVSSMIILSRDEQLNSYHGSLFYQTDYIRLIDIVLLSAFSTLLFLSICQMIYESVYLYQYDNRYRKQAHDYQKENNMWLNQVFLNQFTQLRSISPNKPRLAGALALLTTLLKTCVYTVALVAIVVDFTGTYEDRRVIDILILVMIGCLLLAYGISVLVKALINWVMLRKKEGTFSHLAKDVIHHHVKETLQTDCRVKTDLNPESMNKEVQVIQNAFRDIFDQDTNKYINTGVGGSTYYAQIHKGMRKAVNNMVSTKKTFFINKPFGTSVETAPKDLKDINDAYATYAFEKYALTPYHNTLSGMCNYLDLLSHVLLVILVGQHLSGWGSKNSSMWIVLGYFIYIALCNLVIWFAYFIITRLKTNFINSVYDRDQKIHTTVIQAMIAYFRLDAKKQNGKEDNVRPSAIERMHHNKIIFRLPHDVSGWLFYIGLVNIVFLAIIGVYLLNCTFVHESNKLTQSSVFDALSMCFERDLYNVTVILGFALFLIVACVVVSVNNLVLYESGHSFVINTLDDIVQEAYQNGMTTSNVNILLAYLLMGDPAKNGIKESDHYPVLVNFLNNKTQISHATTLGGPAISLSTSKNAEALSHDLTIKAKKPKAVKDTDSSQAVLASYVEQQQINSVADD